MVSKTASVMFACLADGPCEKDLLLDLITPTGAFRSRDENSAVSLAIVERGARGGSSCGSRLPRRAEEARGEDLELLEDGY